MKRKILSMCAAAAAAAMLLAGCGEPEILDLDVYAITEESAYIRENGSLQVAYVEDFGEQYYTKNGLSEFVTSLADDFNSEHSNGDVSVTGVNVKNGNATVLMDFASVSVYNDFSQDNEAGPSVVTYDADEAHMSYDSVSFMPAKRAKGSKKGNEVITDKTSVISVSGNVYLQTKGKIMYYTDGELIDDYHIRVFDGADAVIIYKK